MRRRIAAERYTIIFFVGLAHIVAGVVQVSIPGALILPGVVLCIVAALRAVQAERDRERRSRGDVELG